MILPGDIGLVQNVNPDTGAGPWFSRLICHCQSHSFEHYSGYEASFTHAFIVEQWGPVQGSGRSDRIIEARGLGVTKAWMDHSKVRFVIIRHPGVTTDEQRATIVKNANMLVGNPYDWKAVIFMLFRHWFKWLSKIPYDDKHHEFCSELVGLTYKNSHIPLPTSMKPSMLWPAELIRMWRYGMLTTVYDSGGSNVKA